jgi:hypothetical protein
VVWEGEEGDEIKVGVTVIHKDVTLYTDLDDSTQSVESTNN